MTSKQENIQAIINDLHDYGDKDQMYALIEELLKLLTDAQVEKIKNRYNEE